MVMEIFNAGIIGCGKMGMQHMKVINASKRAKVIAIADPRLNSAEIRQIVGKSVETYDSAEHLFSKVRLDAVHIVTPPETHYALGKLALENGAHVYIEKPFASRTREAEELIQEAERRGLKLCAGHQLLACPATKDTERIVGNIGELVHVESYFAFRKVRKSLSPADQAIDILPHPVYTLLHYLKRRGKAGYRVTAMDVKSDGEIRAMIEYDGRKGILVVTLKGRPVDSYLKIVGTNGTVYVDYVRGVVTNLSGAGADALAAVINPYRQSWQVVCKTTRALAGMVLKRNRSYEGLSELIDDFYRSISEGHTPIVTPESIVETVAVCGEIAAALKEKETVEEERAATRLKYEADLLPAAGARGRVLITGGTGFLGRAVCSELRGAGWSVVAVSRTIPRYSERQQGIDYASGDLADGIPEKALQRVSAIVHCAAETSGGREDHERNSVEATRKLLQAAAAAGINRFIHISSLAVLKPGRNWSGPLDESSPVDRDNPGRGAYVWGKAGAEAVVEDMARQIGIEAKIIRPGPLVDFNRFEAPGRLGREVGSYFIVMGGRNSRISLCDLQTAARVIRHYLSDYDSMPKILNLVEPEAFPRRALVSRLLESRKDLKAVYVPGAVVRAISSVLWVLQKTVNPSRKPLSIAQAFSSESYDSALAREVIGKAISN